MSFVTNFVMQPLRPGRKDTFNVFLDPRTQQMSLPWFIESLIHSDKFMNITHCSYRTAAQVKSDVIWKKRQMSNKIGIGKLMNYLCGVSPDWMHTDKCLYPGYYR